MKKLSWKIKFAIVLIIATILIYSFNFYIFHDSEEIFSYVMMHLGFIPIDILIVALVIDDIMARKEKEAIFEKLDMLMSVFFSEIGDDLLSKFSSVNDDKNVIYGYLKNIQDWEDDDFKNSMDAIQSKGVKFKPSIEYENRGAYLTDIQTLLIEKRYFLISLLENPNLLEKDNFSALLLATFHLDEELERRGDLNNLTEPDFNHLIGDINRVYSNLMYEYVYYMRYLKRNYPYMISIALRTNPFDIDADIHVKN